MAVSAGSTAAPSLEGSPLLLAETGADKDGLLHDAAITSADPEVRNTWCGCQSTRREGTKRRERYMVRLRERREAFKDALAPDVLAELDQMADGDQRTQKLIILIMEERLEEVNRHRLLTSEAAERVRDLIKVLRMLMGAWQPSNEGEPWPNQRDALRDRLIISGQDTAERQLDEMWPRDIPRPWRSISDARAQAHVAFTTDEAGRPVNKVSILSEQSDQVTVKPCHDVDGAEPHIIPRHACIPYAVLEGQQKGAMCEIEAWEQLTSSDPPVWLPGWLVADAVVSLKGLPREVLRVLPWTHIASVVTILTQISVFAVIQWESHATGTYSWWVLALIIPLFLVKVVVEWKVIRAWIIPSAIHLGSGGLSFKVAGFSVGFQLWMPFAVFCSLLLVVDAYTDAAFSASVLNFNDFEALERVWADTFTRSWLKYVVGTPRPGVLKNVIVTSFVFTLLQSAVELFASAVNTNAVRASLFGIGGAHLFTIYSLTVPVGLALTRTDQLSCLSRQQRGDTQGATAFRSKTLALSHGVLFQALSRVLLSYVLENCVQLYIQVQIFAIHCFFDKLTDDHKINTDTLFWQNAISIGSTFLMAFFKMFEVWEALVFWRKLERIVQDGFATGDSEGDKHFRRSRWIGVGIALSGLFMMFSLLLALAKLCGIFYCDSCILNVLPPHCVAIKNLPKP